MGSMEGKVALVTGAARGQGRSHAVTLAREGCDIVAIDICDALETTAYPAATPEDLAQTAAEIEALGRRCVAVQADVRDGAQMADTVEQGVSAFGTIHIAAANAGILGPSGPIWELDERAWQETIDVNLTGVWQTVKAVAPPMVEQRSGAIVLTSSTQGLTSVANLSPYAAAKHGVIGLMKTAAVDLAPYMVRVNCVCPTTVNTQMILPAVPYFAPDDVDNPTVEDAKPAFQKFNLLPVPLVEPEDVSNAVRFLLSDEARYVTGVALPVDAGTTIQPPAYPFGSGMELAAKPETTVA